MIPEALYFSVIRERDALVKALAQLRLEKETLELRAEGLSEHNLALADAVLSYFTNKA